MPKVTNEILDAIADQVSDDPIARTWVDSFRGQLTLLTVDELAAILHHAAVTNATDDELRAFYRTLGPGELASVMRANAITIRRIASAQQRERVLIGQLTSVAAGLLLRAIGLAVI